MRFLFFDQIVDVESGRRLLARKAFTLDGAYLEEHYRRRPVIPASLLVESVVQAGGWLNFISHDRRIRMVAALVEDVRMHRQVRPGEVLDLEARVLYAHGQGTTMSGEARIGEQTILEIGRWVFANQAVAEDEITEVEKGHYFYMQHAVVDPEKGSGGGGS